jgi:hypothetical protein
VTSLSPRPKLRPHTMARAPSYSMGKQRQSSSPYPSGSKRPSAFDRFPAPARNQWLNEIQAKIDRTLNPPSPPGPSRSPSPIEEDGIPLGVVEVGDDIGLSDDGEKDELDEDEDDEGYVSGEQEEDGSYDEDEEDDDLEDQNPLGLGSQLHGQGSEEGFYEDEEDEEEDEGFEDEENEVDSLQPQLPYPESQQRRLEDEDPSIDPQLVNQWAEAEGDYDEEFEEQGSEEDEGELAEDDTRENEEDVEKENSVTYIGDTDEEEGGESGDEDEGGEENQYTEDDEDIEDEEIDDDGMGGPDALPLEEEGLETQVNYDAIAPVGVEHGQVVYDYRTSDAELNYLRDTQAGLEERPESYAELATGFINPNQLPGSEIQQSSGSGPSNLYPPIPAFDSIPAFTSAAQIIPPWEPSLLNQADIAAEVQAMDNDLIDPSLLADFAQRVEAQASGDLGNTTEAQNTTEMTALADAVMGQYNEEPAQLLNTNSAPQVEELEVIQHGMGEAEDEGYEEDDGSRATSESEDVAVQDQYEGTYHDQRTGADDSGSEPMASQNQTGDEEEDGSDEASDSQDGTSLARMLIDQTNFVESSSADASPGIANTRDAPIEILSSDEEDTAQKADQGEEVEDEDEEDPDEEEEEEEEEEIEPERPAGQHTRFDLDMGDMLTPPRTSSRSSGRTPIPSQPISPAAKFDGPVIAPTIGNIDANEGEEVEEGSEDNEEIDAEQPLEGGYPFSPMAVIDSEPEIQPITEVDPVELGSPVNATETAGEITMTETTDDIEPEEPCQVEVEIEEPVSRGPSVPLVTPAVELPLDTVFPTIPIAEAGLEAIMRVLVAQPDTVEEALDSEEMVTERDDTGVEGDVQVEVIDLEPETAEAEAETVAVVSETASAESDSSPEEVIVDVAGETASQELNTSSEDQSEGENLEASATATPLPLETSPAPVSATDYATIESNTQLLPDPHTEPVETDLTMPDVPFHRSRTPSLVVEPPANPPNPDIVIDRPVDEPPQASTDDLPDPQDPIPDTHITAPLSPHDMRPTLERSPSLFVNVQEVDMMLDPGPNDAREDTPVDFPEHDQPAPPTDLEAPIVPEDLEPRDEPRSVSMEALAPGEAPLEEITSTAIQEQNDEEVVFPEPGEAAPNTYIPSPLDVRRDLPLDVDDSEMAPSLIVEPPSEPATGPPSLTGSGGEDVSSLLGVPDVVVEQGEDEGQEEEDVPTSSNIDMPSAPLRATTPNSEAGPSRSQETRFLSPLRHHHGHGPRQTSVPAPSTRVTRRHTRQSSAAADALSPPVTRQNCHYRKLYMIEGDMSAVVLVPQCTLTDHDKLEEEHSEDRGDATPSDEAEARHQPICEATPRLQTVLTAKLHRIVGSDIFDEAQKTYLLHASDAALLHDTEPEVTETSSKAASVSPIKSNRKSKRLSEAPSESSIVEEASTTKHKRGVSIANTASPVLEVDEVEADAEGRYDLRSKSEAPEVDDGTETETVTGSEIVAEHETTTIDTENKSDDGASTATVSPTSTTQPISKRYSLRSQPDIESTPTTDEPTASQTQTQTTPMTTRRRARESISVAPSAPLSSGKKDNTAQIDETETEVKAEPSTPRSRSKGKGKGKGESKNQSQSPKKERRASDTRYIPGEEDEDNSDSDEDGDKEDIKEEGTDRESSAEIIPYNSDGTPSTSTGRKKRKLGSSLGHNSPWQLERQDMEEAGTPSRKSKKRAVGSKDEPDVPVPVDVGGEEGEEEVPVLPQPKGWMSYIWPFKR